jgi:hypothetical protein
MAPFQRCMRFYYSECSDGRGFHSRLTRISGRRASVVGHNHRKGAFRRTAVHASTLWLPAIAEQLTFDIARLVWVRDRQGTDVWGGVSGRGGRSA